MTNRYRGGTRDVKIHPDLTSIADASGIRAGFAVARCAAGESVIQVPAPGAERDIGGGIRTFASRLKSLVEQRRRLRADCNMWCARPDRKQ